MVLQVLDGSGHVSVVSDPEEALSEFDRLLAEGYKAFEIADEGTPIFVRGSDQAWSYGRPIDAFDEELERILMVQP